MQFMAKCRAGLSPSNERVRIQSLECCSGSGVNIFQIILMGMRGRGVKGCLTDAFEPFNLLSRRKCEHAPEHGGMLY